MNSKFQFFSIFAFLAVILEALPFPSKFPFVNVIKLIINLILDPTPILYQKVTTYTYGGYSQIISSEEYASNNSKKEIPDSFGENFAHETDPFSIPETEESSWNRSSPSGFINQQDPRVQEVDVVGWFE